MKQSTSTSVIFYKTKEEVFAYFPTLPFTDKAMTSYSHIGQHSACSKEYIKGKKMADYRDYYTLLIELYGQGYKNLDVNNLRNEAIECYRKPNVSEIKFGGGATHYRTFTMHGIGLNHLGKLKKWLIANDGQRYYTGYGTVSKVS